MFQAIGVPCHSIVYLSSTSSIWSQSGAAHYAAANTFLDALARRLQSSGMHALAIQYGPFDRVGMAAPHILALSSMGLDPLDPDEVKLHPHVNTMKICIAKRKMTSE